MKTLFIDCGMGAAGDMLTAALLELVDDKETFVEKLNGLNIPKVKYEAVIASKCGINGTHMHVTIDGESEHEHLDHEHHDHEHHHDHDHEHHHEHTHHHSSMHDIEHILSHMTISEKVKEDVLNVYRIIAQAEGHVHGKSVDEIHFHEVGQLDAIADVTAVCMLIDELKLDQIVATPVHVGSGTVKCAHGILPVPAPATAHILAGVPIYGGKISGELCTPTGAALLKYFVNRFGDMPVMSVDRIGYGLGHKDFEVANVVRTMIGETEDKTDVVVELSCNIDDMTGEEVGYATNILLESGARDVFTTPINMKKNRPGIMLTIITTKKEVEKMVELIFKHTTTLGIRKCEMERFVLDRQIVHRDTKWGNIECKVSSGYGVTREKYEYNDIAKIAKDKNVSIAEVKASL